MSAVLAAVKLKGRINPNRQLELPLLPPDLPPGEVELILLYKRELPKEESALLSPLVWPVLDGGRYLGGTLRREELYDDDGR